MANKYIIQAFLSPNKKTNIEEIGHDYQVIVPESYKIVYVGVQGLPGIRMGLGASSTQNAVYLNGNGFFELDLQGSGTFLDTICVNKSDFEIRANENNLKGYLIIDCIAVADVDLDEEKDKKLQVKGEEVMA